MCVHIKPFFLPVDIQHTQCPCRFFIRERYKLCRHKCKAQPTCRHSAQCPCRSFIRERYKLCRHKCKAQQTLHRSSVKEVDNQCHAIVLDRQAQHTHASHMPTDTFEREKKWKAKKERRCTIKYVWPKSSSRKGVNITRPAQWPNNNYGREGGACISYETVITQLQSVRDNYRLWRPGGTLLASESEWSEWGIYYRLFLCEKQWFCPRRSS